VSHVAQIQEMRNAYKTIIGELEEKNHAEDLGVDGMIVLE